ncbi:hypothetical protein AB0F77_04470 [Streptomyces sp. NPDC026672]|uniref:hypothetical protein n=1 Tax=unclassified Streptomyces TaxID=2593676 RepID=UPI003407B598
MKRRTVWRTAATAVSLAVSLVALPAQAHATPSGDLAPARAQALVEQLESMPAAGRARADSLQEQVGADDGLSADPTLSTDLINPADYQCTTSTPVRDWAAATTADWTASDAGVANLFQQIVLLDAVLFPDGDGNAFGTDGEFSTQVGHTIRDLRKFWDIDGSRVRVVPMHSDVLLDRAELSRVFGVGFGFDETTSAQLADAVAQLADQDKFDHGLHPLFTFNAFAVDTLDVPGLGTIPPEIVMGDGVLEGFRAVGLDDVAPQAILAHEYGHHVQYQKDLFTSELTGPEASRRTELMADSFGSYFLTHARGESMRWKRVQEFSQVFFQLGDCSFTAASHHGTPNQRLHAVQWGYGVARDARNQGHILPSAVFADRFEQELPTLVAPDA